MAKINFSEQLNIGYYADFRVFIFGVEVSEYVVDSLSWLLADRNGENTANFTLQNAFDNFVLTPENLGIEEVNQGTGEKLYRNVGKPVFRTPKSGEPMYSELPKKLLVSRKQGYTPDGAEKPAYPLGVRNIVIHKNDPVRIFAQNPLKLGEWYNVFTGYVDTVQKTGSYISGQSTISVSCYDIRSLMQKMRVSKQPTYGKAAYAEILLQPNNFFGDMINPTTNNHPFAKTSYENTVEALILGQFDGQKKQVNTARGVGEYVKGDVYYYDAEKPESSFIQTYDSTESKFGKKGKIERFRTKQEFFDEWYKLCLFGELGRPLTEAEVTRIGGLCAPGEAHAPDQQKFYMLLPTVKGDEGTGTGIGASSLTEYHMSQGVEERDFTSRYDIIKQFSETIDYQFWVTGSGDIVFEFPMYEFKPTDFGDDIANLLTLDQLVIDDTVVDEGENIPTVLIATGGAFSERTDISGQAASNAESAIKNVMPRVVVANPGLAARFGVNAQNIAMPTVTNKNSLQLLAWIEFNRRMFDANKLNVSFSWRPWLLPNKPHYHREEERIGNTSSVSNRMTLFKDCSTDVTLRYVRKRNEKGKFVFLDGSETLLASYARAWASQTGTGVLSGATFIDQQNSKLSKYNL